MGRVPPYKCGLCGKHVLGIYGQDGYLPSYLEGNHSAVLAENKATGWAHAVCLKTSGFDELWESLNVNNLMNSSDMAITHKSPGLCIMMHKNTGDRIVVLHGAEFRVSDADVKHAEIQDNSIRIPILTEYYLDLTNFPQLLDEVSLALNRDKKMAFLDLIDAFGVTDRLLVPSALTNSEIRPLADDPSTTFEDLDDGELSVLADYAVVLNGIPESALQTN